MENASNALLIAGGVLIGILILSLAVYLFTSFGTTSAEINQRKARQQIVEFNTQYTVYANREDLTIYDIITVANMANQNNSQYSYVNNFTTDYEISIYLDSQRIDNKSQDEFDTLMQESLGNNQKYKSGTPEYYSETSGRIKSLRFNKIT